MIEDDDEPEMTLEQCEEHARAMANDELELVERCETLPDGRRRCRTTWERKDRDETPL